MKTREWERFLREQKELYDKKLFTIAELANVADTTPGILNVELSRLRKTGIIERYARGAYGLKGVAEPEDLVPYLDRRSYITGFFALYRHQLVTQAPTVIVCFTDRRHDRYRERETPVGRYEFVCVSRSVYSPPQQGVMSEPEQALFDFVYLARRRGVDPESIVTFRNLKKLREPFLLETAPRYPGTVRRQVSRILSGT